MIVRGLAVAMHEKTLRVSLTSEGTVTNLVGGMAIGFMAPLLSERIFEEEDAYNDGDQLDEGREEGASQAEVS